MFDRVLNMPRKKERITMTVEVYNIFLLLVEKFNLCLYIYLFDICSHLGLFKNV